MNTDIAHDAAYRREQRITELCNHYVRRARAAYRAGEPGRGEFLLARLGLKLARLEGCKDSVEALEDLRYVRIEPGPSRLRALEGGGVR